MEQANLRVASLQGGEDLEARAGAMGEEIESLRISIEQNERELESIHVLRQAIAARENDFNELYELSESELLHL